MRSDHPANAVQLSVPTGRTYAIVSTYPPTPCGVATFSAALSAGLQEGGAAVDILRLGDGGTDLTSPRAARTLRQADVVIVQHEYGIYAGLDGDAVLDLLDGLVRPTILVAHTVLATPTDHQRSVLETAVRRADAVVVMTDAGRERLCLGYDVNPAKITVIPHGAAVAPASDGAPRAWGPGAMLTWGLLGPGKGIEHAIDALALLRDVLPRPQYVIAGDTHPKVAAADGESYRNMLSDRAHAIGVGAQVHFDPGYRSLPELAELIRSAALVVLPYDSPDQVTSGVLVDAIAAGRPVVATAFPHAIELLSGGAGLVVPQRDTKALAAALRRVLTEPELASDMAAEARRLGPDLAWSAIASRYAALGQQLLADGQMMFA